jgi:hypothetical protein
MKVKAATLIESIIALLLISIAFGISILTYISVLNSGNRNQKEVVHQIIRSLAIDTKSQSKFIEQSFEMDSITYFQTVEKVNAQGLLQLNIKAKSGGKLLEEYNEYIIGDDKN